jgi:hypothetical protein
MWSYNKYALEAKRSLSKSERAIRDSFSNHEMAKQRIFDSNNPAADMYLNGKDMQYISKVVNLNSFWKLAGYSPLTCIEYRYQFLSVSFQSQHAIR